MSIQAVKEIFEQAANAVYADETGATEVAAMFRENMRDDIATLKPKDQERFIATMNTVVAALEAALPLPDVPSGDYDAAYITGLRARHGEENVHVRDYGNAKVIEVEG